MMFHDGKMHGAARRQLLLTQDNPFRTFYDGPFDSQHLVHDAEERVECGLDCVAAVDC